MKRYKILWLGMVILLAVSLAACGSSSSSSSTTTTTSASSKGSTNLSEVNKLLVGTLKLENTDQAVTAQEAAQLLPLWQAYLSLSSSQTAAQAEVDGLLTQIQSSMTTQQVEAINAMKLTATDMTDLMQSMGAGMGPQGTPNPQVTPGANFPSGGFPSDNPPDSSSAGSSGGTNSGTTRNFPAGGPPSGGGPMPGGDAGSAAGLGGAPMTQGTQDPSMQATAQARFSTQASQVNMMLLQVLINKLQALTSQ